MRSTTPPGSRERRAKSTKRARGERVLVTDIHLKDFAPPAEGRKIGLKRRPDNPREHFLRIVELARKEFGEPSPRSPDAPPLISFVVPVFNTPAPYLDDLLNSFREQSPGLAEMILSDDGSTSAATARWLKAHEGEPGLTILRNPENKGIAAASNAGFRVCRGEWIGLVDHDDALAPFAVPALARAIAENPDAKFIYTDEIIADGKLVAVDAFLKPAFDDVLLSGVNYINHLSLYRCDRLNEIGGFREGFDGSQDYDLLLRYLAGLEPSAIRHLPYPAYIWRRDGASYSVKFIDKATSNARRAISQAHESAPVEPALNKDLHRPRFEARLAPAPKVSIVIPNKDSFDLISRLVDGLLHATRYPDFEICVVDNGSTDPRVLALYERLQREEPKFRVDIAPAPFNFSRQVNRGMHLATGELMLLLNNDIEIREPDWLMEMASCFAYPRTGIVGARLLYPDDTLQHAGVIVGLGGLAGHWFVGQGADHPGPMARLHVRSSLTAVTGACMMISKACLDAVGPFDEENFAIAYNDVDFCLRAKAAGFRTVYTPFAALTHWESATRGRDDRGPNRARFVRDQAALLATHGTETYEDAAFNPWYDRDHSDLRWIALDRLPSAR